MFTEARGRPTLNKSCVFGLCERAPMNDRVAAADGPPDTAIGLTPTQLDKGCRITDRERLIA
jgi:hypothetical protein